MPAVDLAGTAGVVPLGTDRRSRMSPPGGLIVSRGGPLFGGADAIPDFPEAAPVTSDLT